MEEGLLMKVGEEKKKVLTWDVLKEESKIVGYLAGPIVAATLSQFLLQLTSIMMVGHLGELSLSSTAIATSFCGATGFSLLMGMASGLETLCGQANGAKQYQKLGNYMYSSIISLVLLCIPLSLIWINMEKILTFLGQDPQISFQAGKYAIWSIPALFAYAILQPLMRYLQSQSLTLPMLLSSFAALCIHIPLCWALVYYSGLQAVGAALAIGLSYWLNVIFLVVYITYSPFCKKTYVPLSKEALTGISMFLRLAIPSTVMMCLECWSYDLLTLLSGRLPNPQLETSVLSVCITTISFLYTIPFGLGAAASIRVSNELGAGNPQGARVAVYVVMFIAVAEAIIVSSTLFACRKILGYAYSNETEVIDYVTEMVPLICLSVSMDSLQGVLSGIARGTGWQDLGAYVNLGSFYLAGIPVAVLLSFHLNLRGKGLWTGIVIGTTVQSALLAIITSTTNWRQQAIKARERIFEGAPSIENHTNK
ncbi:Detoxification-like protein [Thalictrum thalictroides]|uniref:Protein DETOXIFICATION n=1 Tax=Thalictrum thalictroides TaxID=46969 RepID=A0A7J6V8J7_THATH|nr:Detoxification-like protein [Thalictrum thalictroides]